MPKLWTDAVDSHRRAVRGAVLDAVTSLVRERGMRGVTMTELAGTAGVGRATLYKYLPDLDSVLGEWHERYVAEHIDRLETASAAASDPENGLRSALVHYAMGVHAGREARHTDLGVLLHSSAHVLSVESRLKEVVLSLLLAGVAARRVRADVPAEELAAYCLHALGAAAVMPSEDAVRRLVDATMDALAP